jgi:hypothetical protein
MRTLYLFINFVLSFNAFNKAAFADVNSHHTCPAGAHWVKAHHRRAYAKSDGTQISATSVTAHCQTNPTAYSNWHDRLKNGRPADWLQNQEKAKSWSEEERERVIDALSDLPPSLLIDTVRGIFRLDRSQAYDANPASGQDGEITVYDPAFTKEQNLARILGHEMAHELYRHLSVDDKRNYLFAADWLPYKNTKTGEWLLIPNRDQYVAEDGKESPTEDFSNNIEYYLFDPDALKVKSPKVYDWIQKKFGDTFKLAKGVRK